jgi:hypothetical protein
VLVLIAGIALVIRAGIRQQQLLVEPE